MTAAAGYPGIRVIWPGRVAEVGARGAMGSTFVEPQVARAGLWYSQTPGERRFGVRTNGRVSPHGRAREHIEDPTHSTVRRAPP
jgi:hypothetical protein